MLSPRKSLLKQSCQGLLECCNKQSHMQMLLREDYQQPPTMERHDSKPNTELTASTKQNFFKGGDKKPFSHKISLSQRRNSMNVETFSKKQKERFSNFNHETKKNYKMMSQMNQNISPSSKKENLSIIIDEQNKKAKKSLRQQRQEKQANNRPFLLQFSHMEEFCDSDGNLLHLDSKSLIQNLNKFNYSFMVDFKETVPKPIQRISLKLGQNLPTHRSQLNNTQTEFTKRSEVL